MLGSRIRDTYWHRLNEGRKLDSTSLSSDDKRRFRFVVDEITRCATPEERQLLEAEIPERNSDDWINWKNSLEKVSLDITTRAFGELEERERASCGIVASGKSKKNLVTAMEKRLREVIKKEKEKSANILPSNILKNPFVAAEQKSRI